MNDSISQKSGIYKIINYITGDLYIGQTYDFYNRRRHHLLSLRKGIHFNRYLQRAWNKYGGNNFEFVPILICEKNELTYYEQKCVDLFNPAYNICRECVTSTLGFKMPEESVRIRAIKNSGPNNWIFGKHQSDEVKRKLSIANTGHKITEETRKKLSIATLNFSDETKEKIRKGLTGRHHTEETKRKIGEGNKGKILSEETKRKLSLARTGKHYSPHSEETKKKMSLKRIKYWATRKAGIIE